ncbi:13926_t:CDS:2, partial [Entrophospora sp. SA101]
VIDELEEIIEDKKDGFYRLLIFNPSQKIPENVNREIFQVSP